MTRNTARRSRVTPLSQRYTRTIVTRVTEAQADTITAAADALGVSVAEVIRAGANAAATQALAEAPAS